MDNYFLPVELEMKEKKKQKRKSKETGLELRGRRVSLPPVEKEKIYGSYGDRLIRKALQGWEIA